MVGHNVTALRHKHSRGADSNGEGPVAAPPHLYRSGADPVWWALDRFSNVWFPFWNRVTTPVVPPAIDATTTLEVIRREVVAHDENVVALTFAAPDRRELAPWRPGGHLDLLLASGKMREYSLCGDPSDRFTYRIGVRRIPGGGGGSIEVHDTLTERSRVRIKGPRNGFPLALPGHGSTATRLRFIAAGIGITPILPMAAAAQRLGIDWSMIYTGRSLDSIPFTSELARFGDRVTIRTDDDHGFPTPTELLGETEGGVAVYCCGPVPMLESMRSTLVGRDDIEFHYERFSPPPVVDGNRFSVRFARSGVTADVSDDEQMLHAMQRAVPSVAYSCRQGFCGTCRVRVVSGVPDHRDHLLTDDERAAGWMLSCVSRCAGDELEIDV